LDLFSDMKSTHSFLWFLFFCLVAFSCNDDGGSIATGEDEQLTDNELAFREFLKENSQRFIHTTSGLKFVSTSTCAVNTEMQLAQKYFVLETAECNNRPLDSPLAYLITNQIKGFEGLAFITLYFRVLPTDVPLSTGTYYNEWTCGISSCYQDFYVSIYTVDSEGEGTVRFGAAPDKITVVSEGGTMSISFDAQASASGFEEHFDLSATLTCCR